jgi:serine/threonine/tyrosine-interacting protein
MSRYEQRREAQEIIPNLYLGPYQSSNKLEVLLGMGITHMYVNRWHMHADRDRQPG